jgi:hypothetical protein
MKILITEKQLELIINSQSKKTTKVLTKEQLMNYAQKKVNINSTTPYPYTWDVEPTAPKPSTVQATPLEPWDYKSNNDDNPKSFDEFVEGIRNLLTNPISIGVEVPVPEKTPEYPPPLEPKFAPEAVPAAPPPPNLVVVSLTKPP